jgi:superfamily II DNA/RNA helicase
MSAMNDTWDKLECTLSAPILKHIEELGFQKMTPVQVYNIINNNSIAKCTHL